MSDQMIAVIFVAALILAAITLSGWNYFGKRRQEILSAACREILVKIEYLNLMITDYLTFRGYPNKHEPQPSSDDKSFVRYKEIIDTRYAVTKMEIGKLKDDLLSKLGKTEFKNECLFGHGSVTKENLNILVSDFFTKDIKKGRYNELRVGKPKKLNSDSSVNEDVKEGQEDVGIRGNVVAGWSRRQDIEKLFRRRGFKNMVSRVVYVKLWIDLCRLEFATTVFCRALGPVKDLDEVADSHEYFNLRQAYETVVKEIYQNNSGEKIGLSEVVSIISLSAAIVSLVLQLIFAPSKMLVP